MFFYKKLMIIEIIVAVIVFINWGIQERKYQNIVSNYNDPIIGSAKVVSSKSEKKNTNQYLIKYQNDKYLLYVDKEVSLEYGDIIAFEGYFKSASSSKNFKLFDYSDYLKQQKIYGVLDTNKIVKIAEEKDIFYYIERFKLHLKQNLYEVFEKEQAGFLAGLLLGDKESVSSETKDDFQDSSLSHILAISGMHVVYVSFGMKFLLDLFIARQRLKNFLMMFLLIFFAFFTGGSPSCLRACLMCSMVYLSKVVYRKNDFYVSFIFSLNILLLINCYYIKSIGLWLSYFATFGIVYFQNKQKSNIISESIKTSLASNVMIFPIIWNCYNRISLTFFISNMLVSFLIGPTIVLGYIHLFLGQFSNWFAILEKGLLSFIFYWAKSFGSLKLSRILVPSISVYYWMIYYIFIIGAFYLYHHQEMWIKRKKQMISFSFVFLVVGIFILFPKERDLEIHFLDVGQGDCTLIITPQRRTILIDGGNNEGYDNGKNIVAPYLLKNGFKTVDYLIVSHR